MMRTGAIAFALGGSAGVFGGALMVRYREDKRRLITLLLAGSQVADTSCGPVEYAVLDEGPPLLISPGGGGGYDQGLYLAALFRGTGLQLIAVSRPGYLRTPLSAGRTPEQQADVFAALLDELGIWRTAVLAISAGGPAALQFALKYPDRCYALVMASAFSRPARLTPIDRLIRGIVLRSDFFPWLLNRLWQREVFIRNGISPELLERIRGDAIKKGVLRGLLQADITSSLRRDGIFNDNAQISALPDYDLKCLSVPVMVVHSPGDPVVPFSDGRRLARSVPGAVLLAVPEGGHLCLVTHREEIVPEVVRFLNRHAPWVESPAIDAADH